jgi:MoxR-like ATPase
MLSLRLDYPSFEEEIEIVKRTTGNKTVQVNTLLDSEMILKFQSMAREVVVPDSVLKFAVTLVTKSRPKSQDAPDFVKQYISWGAGPRASQNLILASKTRALSQGRFNVTDEDIKALAVPVLRHRIVHNYTAEAEGISTDDLILRLVKSAH